MEFGSTVLPSGAVRFRLWAPEAEQISLCLLEGEKKNLLPMPQQEEGWFHLETEQARPGSRYSFQLASGLLVPDPASRFQPQGVHGPSEVIAPADFSWEDADWPGRSWEEAVLYELHVGSFSPRGTFAGVEQRLDYLVDLGITGIELMPVAAFPGHCNWGYDGVLPFAPASCYGRPDDLKRLVAAAHGKGLMVLLDVVYNHFGPEGNYLHCYAPQFFTERYHTPWGAALNFDGPGSLRVRQFFIENALYWLEEFHFDGLRLDAVHAIHDRSRPDILEELAMKVRSYFPPQRRIHLILENDNNQSRYLKPAGEGRPRSYTAQWNDDLHHSLHVLLTGETTGYYLDYAGEPLRHLGRCLAEGFAYQGEASPYRDNGPRGEPSRGLPAAAFVNFLQNHDQIGNRALGERISLLAEPDAIRAALALLLLAPSPPLLFMGEEWGSRQPFPFFCDFSPDLAGKVSKGRRQEFARFPEFSAPESRERIPDPNAGSTFLSARLDWSGLDSAEGAEWHGYCRRLLALRRRKIIPILPLLQPGENRWHIHEKTALAANWPLKTGGSLQLVANLGRCPSKNVILPELPPLFTTHAPLPDPAGKGALPSWSVSWFLVPAPQREEGRQ